MEVLVFKTNIKNKKQVANVSRLIFDLNDILRWNVDLHDCDKVLRIETNQLSPRQVESLLQEAGYVCEELED